MHPQAAPLHSQLHPHEPLQLVLPPCGDDVREGRHPEQRERHERSGEDDHAWERHGHKRHDAANVQAETDQRPAGESFLSYIITLVRNFICC